MASEMLENVSRINEACVHGLRNVRECKQNKRERAFMASEMLDNVS